MKVPVIIRVLLLVTCCMAIGMQIPPISSDESKHMSSLKNLRNCVGYRTSRDDLILVKIRSGDRVSSQHLNLRVFDSDNNILRSSDDISNDLSFIFTNLNNPVQIQEDKSYHILDRFRPRKEQDPKVSELMNPYDGNSFVYICFDNLYYDKSWSFRKQNHDVDLQVQIRNATTLGEINYSEFAKYFSNLKPQVGSEAEGQKAAFTQQNFEDAMKELNFQLDEISENLRSSSEILNTLKSNQASLRDANELIFSSYTKTSIVVFGSICAFGGAQMIYFMCFCKKRRIL